MTLTISNRIEPLIPTRYIIQPVSESSSNADVMITAVRTYFDMSIMKSETFSQTDTRFTKSFSMTKIVKISFETKLAETFTYKVVL